MTKPLETILENYSHSGPDSLIPILQEVQEQIGCISEEAIVQIGKHLRIPTSKIFGLATFYSQFRFEQKGKYHIKICHGSACHLFGSVLLIDLLEKNLKIKDGQRTKNALFSIEVVTCLGACAHSPVIMINDEYYSGLTVEKLNEILNGLLVDEPMENTRQ